MTDETREAECRVFLDRWPEAEYGPAHIVVADYNFEPGHLQWCSGVVWAIQEARRTQPASIPIELYQRNSDAELEATSRLLSYLSSGEHPQRVAVENQGRLTVKSEPWTDVQP